MSTPGQTVLLTNMVAPYRVPLFIAIGRGLPSLKILVDTERESDRSWDINYSGLDVELVHGLTVRRPGPRDAGQEWHMGWALGIKLAQLMPRTVISAELGFRTAVASLYRRVRPHTRLILWLCLSEHTERAVGRSKRFLRRWILDRADAAVVSGHSAQQYVRSLNQRIPIYIAPQAVDNPQTRNKATQVELVNTLRLIFVGSPAPRKNLEWMVEHLTSWARATGASVELTAVGVEWGAAPEHANSHLTIQCTGYLPNNTVLSLYNTADAMIFPTLEDEWGLVTNESLMQGCPVIGSILAQSVPELIQDGVNGWAFDPRVEGDLETALDNLYETKENPIAYSTMRDNARKTMQSVTIQRMADTFLSAIRNTRDNGTR